ncbi:sensor domain-containing protein [Ornithinibacillus contaminans]|uniref:sensor domain-containing protein n=1 Tax=Ornithinibacillus contaminans TaxID=694055 RepID=UPI00064DE513|nr:diguanylate cyclase [Ornithinibacillus contaminans]
MERFFESFGTIEGFKYIMDSVKDLVIVLEVRGTSFHYVFINQSAASVLNADVEQIRGKSIEAALERSLATKLAEHSRQVVTRKKPLKFEQKFTKDDVDYIGEISLNPIIAANGKCNYVVGIIRDVTEKWRHYRELKVMKQSLQDQQIALNYQKEQYKSLFLNHPDAIYLLSLEGDYISCNAAAESLSGYSSEELIGKSFKTILLEQEVEKAVEQFELCLKERLAVSYELKFRNKNHLNMILLITNIPFAVGGEIAGVFGIAKDITEFKRQEEKLERMAYHDYLTGLANRREFDKSLELALDKAALVHENVGLMLLDGYGFKTINDTYGHDAGDAVIKEMAIRIQAAVRDSDIVARIGGDELAIILPAVNSTMIKAIATRILDAFKEPLTFHQHMIEFGVSIGIACYPEHAIQLDELVKAADEALYEAKRRGYDYVIYRS